MISISERRAPPASSTERKNESRPPRWLPWARAACIGFALLTLTLFVVTIPDRHAAIRQSLDPRSLQQLGWSAATFAGYAIGLSLLVLVAHLVLAALILWKRAGDGVALLVALALATNGALLPFTLQLSMEAAAHLPTFLVRVVIYLALISSVVLLYVFPDGKFVPGWTRWLALLWALLAIPSIFAPSSSLGLPSWPFALQVLTLLVWSGTGVYAQVYRYVHVSRPEARQQAKWAVAGLIAAVLGPFLFFRPEIALPSLGGAAAPNLLYQRVGASAFSFSLAAQSGGLTVASVAAILFPLSFAIAILRYRLWDVDVLINRTLVYTGLTALLALTYFAGIALVETVLRALAPSDGAFARSEVSVVASTLAIIALFNPLRRRMQTTIDRRFYRRKYDAEKTLAQFSQTARDEVDIERITRTLLSLVKDSMEPDYLSLWLQEAGSGKESRQVEPR